MSIDWTKVWDEVRSWFSNVGKELEDELMPFVKQFASNEGQAVLAAATKAVAIFATQVLTGAQKQAGAYDVIVADLKSQSITAATSLVNSGIEVALSKLKSAQ